MIADQKYKLMGRSCGTPTPTGPADQFKFKFKETFSFPIGGLSRTLEEVYKKIFDLEPIVKSMG
jgi:hypothetical protein